MEFLRERVYTALNADELRAGDKVLTSNNMASLKEAVRLDIKPSVIVSIWGEMYDKRFQCKSSDTIYDAELAYLVERKENCANCSHSCKSINPCLRYEPKTEQKAEKHYRPFKDTDELIKVWNKKFYLDFKPSHDPLTMPYIWVRVKECNKGGLLITYFGEDEVKTDAGFLTMSKLLNAYTFTDGSVCGVEE